MTFSKAKKGSLVSPLAVLIAFCILSVGYGLLFFAISDEKQEFKAEELAFSYPSYVLNSFLYMPLNEEELEQLSEEERSQLSSEKRIRVRDILELGEDANSFLVEDLKKRYLEETREERLGSSVFNYLLFSKLVSYELESNGELYPSSLLYIENDRPEKTLTSFLKEYNAYYLLSSEDGELITLYFAEPGSFEEVQS
jgi:hypothetical protein